MRPSLTTLLALSMIAACSASPPEDTPDLSGPDAGQPTDDVDPEGKPSLSIDPFDSETPYGSVPVTGLGPAHGTLIVETPTTEVAADIASDGTFCVDVPLQSGIENVLWFEAVDDSGAHSDVVERRITQAGDPPDGEVEPTMRNIARLGSVNTEDVTVETGMAQFMADGDTNTFARIQNATFHDPDWFSIELTDTDAPIDHIKVYGTDDCPLENYYVMLSESDSPGVPDALFPSNNDWIEVGRVIDGGTSQTITPPLGTKPKARYIALTELGFGCGTFVGNNEIKEVEVWTVEAGGPTGPEGPTCASGGQ